MTTNNPVQLFGIDVGSTTCSAMAASARVVLNCVTGRREFGEVTNLFTAAPEFTPYVGQTIDEAELENKIHRWITEAAIDPRMVTAGGVIVTGFAAQAKNAAAVGALVRRRFKEVLVVTADDPRLESWLAFMGNSLRLSRQHADKTILNFDIGGGTTNLAWGRAGEVLRAGSLFLGARHLRFQTGTNVLDGISAELQAVLTLLDIRPVIGEPIQPNHLQAVLDLYISMLEAIATGDSAALDREPQRQLWQAVCPVWSEESMVITLSGGVGELAYRGINHNSWPTTTAFGDMGIELARRICASPIFAPHLLQYTPEHLGRATVFGLTLHNTAVSGTTLHLPRNDLLPLSDLPIVGTLTAAMPDHEMQAKLELARHGGQGGCLMIVELPGDAISLRAFGSRLADSLEAIRFPPNRPLVLLVEENVGKTLGQYATRWGQLPVTVIVVDQIPLRNAHFASLGLMRDNFVPVSFYGIQPDETPEKQIGNAV